MLADNFATKQPYYWGLMNTVRIRIIHYINEICRSFQLLKTALERQVNQENVAMEMPVIHRWIVCSVVSTCNLLDLDFNSNVLIL